MDSIVKRYFIAVKGDEICCATQDSEMALDGTEKAQPT